MAPSSRARPICRLAFARLSPSGGPLPGPERDFHVQRAARDRLGIDDGFFSIRGDVVFADLQKSHEFAHRVNQEEGRADAARLRASQVNAMGLLHEVFHGVLAAYRQGVRPDTLQGLLQRFQAQQGAAADATLLRFVETFPPPAVYRGELRADQYLAGETAGVPNRAWVAEELLLLWLTNQNPAYAPIQSIVSDAPLRSDPGYAVFIEQARAHFASEPGFGPGGQSLLDLLLEPIRRHPESIEDQLRYLRANWGMWLGGLTGSLRLLLGLDFIAEEGKWFLRSGHGVGEDLAPRTFSGELYDQEPEKFSADLHWMPRVVLLAKSAFVWLDQLSKAGGRPVRTLADIPDEELDTIARRGFTGLWLIGLWRRSPASRRIKQLCGNPEAAASAYSLMGYDIAPELGGWDAWRVLRDKCARRGVRLASDMVPNHTGLDSDWVREHPDWFIQTDRPPFPGYTFEGPELGEDPRVSLKIEDGYWRRTDAAVVFRRIDRYTGHTRFLYHGNDGTSMPWNDTAQLDYLRADVREAVIQTILHVARHFPIIRFDAAMTLAKRHYQRLWFPQPGTGGDIPSRAAFALSKERFEELFPVEFWREVVDRVQAEAPDTLLLAEAFWLMEGYFVRTLGMHRVYNSAFMNMLKREENAAYRSSVRNVLEFNPQILKRHVNFMNNPDEDTAVAQFGTGDKFFGVSLMLATLPGLPMFGHGQVEGLTEKYGMEYLRAYKDERPDEGLVARHEREIFPLLRRRALFAEVEQFHLYDFAGDDGQVDEDVFVWSNRFEGERALLFFHNKYKQARGRARDSVGFLGGSGGIERRTLAEGLALSADAGACSIFRDHLTGLWYVRENRELREQGFQLELGAFQARAFLDWREVQASAEAPWDKLARQLAGAGVPSADEALADLRFRAIQEPFYEAVNAGSAAWLFSVDTKEPERESSLRRKLRDLADGLAWLHPQAQTEAPPPGPFLEAQLRRGRAGAAALGPIGEAMVGLAAAGTARAAGDATAAVSGAATASAAATAAESALPLAPSLTPPLAPPLAPPPPPEPPPTISGVPPWHFLAGLLFSRAADDLAALLLPAVAEAGVEVWHLPRVVERAFRAAGAPPEAAGRAAELVALLLSRPRIAAPPIGSAALLRASLLLLLGDERARTYLRVNLWDGVAWFDRDALRELLAGLALEVAQDAPLPDAGPIAAEYARLDALALSHGYRLEPFSAALAAG